MAGGTGIRHVRIQADAGMMSPASIQLRWTIIKAAMRQWGREESYPVKKCRNKTSCDVHVPSNIYHHGNPVLMITGSYQNTPWMKTVIRVPLQEQSNHGEEVLLLVPWQTWQNRLLQQQAAEKPSEKASHESIPKEGRPLNLRDNSKWRNMENPRNSVKNQETSVPTKVRRARRGRNDLTYHQEQATSRTCFG
eukprot:XP_011669025.1 PREDICTED: uncharacterized protein LOC105440496 [Strongylocentrotus purpuratus]